MTDRPPSPKPPLLQRRGLRLAATGLTVAFLAAALVQGWSRISDFEWDLSPTLLGLGVLVIFLHLAAHSLAYADSIARVEPGRPTPRAALAVVWAKSMLARYVPGKVLMVLVRLSLAEELGVSKRASATATFYEQVLAVVIGGVGSIVFLALYGDLGGEIPALPLLVLVVPMFALLHPAILGPVSGWALRRLKRPPLTNLLDVRNVAVLAAMYVGSYALMLLGVGLLVHGLVGSSAGSLPFIGLAFMLSYTIAFIAFIFPSGLGLREGVFAVALATGVPLAVAVAASVGVRLIMTVIELAFAGLGTVLVKRRQRRARASSSRA